MAGIGTNRYFCFTGKRGAEAGLGPVSPGTIFGLFHAGFAPFLGFWLRQVDRYVLFNCRLKIKKHDYVLETIRAHCQRAMT